MTRKEAEKYIKSKMCNNCGIYLGGGKCSDNCNVIEAIQALSQEPCDNVVNREAVKQGMMKYGFTAPDMTVHEFIEDELPSVTVQQCSLYSVSEDGRGQCALLNENPNETPLAKEFKFPKYATNGDMIKAMFPNCIKDEDEYCFGTNLDIETVFRKDWWNAPYQKGGKEYNAE